MAEGKCLVVNGAVVNGAGYTGTCVGGRTSLSSTFSLHEPSLPLSSSLPTLLQGEQVVFGFLPEAQLCPC